MEERLLSVMREQNADIQMLANSLTVIAVMAKASLLIAIVNLLLLLKLFIGQYQLAKNQIDIAGKVQMPTQ